MEAPSPPQMPSPPAGGGGSSDFFNPTQWTVLLALLDTVIPAVVPTSAVRDPRAQEGVDDAEFRALTRRARASMASPPDDAALQAYLAEAPSAQPAFVHGVRRTLAGVTDGARRQLGAVLLALATRPGSLVLTGHAVAVHELPVHVRAAVLRRWGASWFASLRLLAKSLAMMAKVNWLQTSGLFRQVTGYPDVPPGWTARPPAALDFVQFPPGPAGASGTSGAAGADELVSVDTDIVVVGSGCGGAVCAKVLAEAGHRVLVVDKGYYFPPSQLPMPQEQGVHYLYENGGFIQTTDQSVALVAGSCFGGGGTVNWSASLQTQGFVRREWAREHQLPLFETAEFQACLDRVCAVMGVADPVRQSDRGQRILDGAHKLGWHAAACPQNAAGSDHHCGHCHLGCGSAEKQGPVVSWLPAAARAGARFLEGFAVDRIRWDESVDEARDPLRATGVLGTWTSRDAAGSVSGPAGERVTRRVEIRAKKVIISAGTLNSPLILMRSGLTNRHIGQNLHLHPVNFVAAYYNEDVRPWEGGIITSLCTSFEDLDGHGHGVKLEGTCVLPYCFLTHMPSDTGLDYKLAALRYRHMNGWISLTRDRDTGRVFPDPTTGRPCVEYTPSAFDAAHTLEGVLALAKISYITGASEIRVFLPNIPPFIRPAAAAAAADTIDPGITDPAFVAWLAAVRAAGNRPPGAPFSSAHQMGTCRMSSHAGAGVVDARGRVWGARDLLVADASVFPSASGANPMVTNMAIADWIARRLVDELGPVDLIKVDDD